MNDIGAPLPYIVEMTKYIGHRAGTLGAIGFSVGTADTQRDRPEGQQKVIRENAFRQSEGIVEDGCNPSRQTFTFRDP